MAEMDSSAAVPAKLVSVKINLGCGIMAQRGWVNVDIVQTGNVDVVHDLDTGPWPFEDGSAEEIQGFDIFEHVNDPILFMTECHRVLKVGGRLHLRTSYWKSENAFTDPTHKRFCTEKTFDYWCEGELIYRRYNAMYGGVAFRKIVIDLDGQELDVWLRKV